MNPIDAVDSPYTIRIVKARRGGVMDRMAVTANFRSVT
ncbi:hypothetical protein BX591_12514 [Paraburkholderia bryophila]|jgi:hypothetical protein|uniref:Uncharacterized protein n=1 Tax=Paraburkholderia bryophila TaxID=420952 RepID=A0A329BJJ7_9BURK|nr:hypothetical protein BX591_12514 [Paraburkholderia bryophila]